MASGPARGRCTEALRLRGLCWQIRLMVRSGRAQLNDVIPVLPARDVGQAINFYVDRLGFEPVFQDAATRPQYAGVRRGAVEVHLQFQFERDFEVGSAGQCMLRLYVDNPELLFEEYKDKGVFHDDTQMRDTPGALESSPSGISTTTD